MARTITITNVGLHDVQVQMFFENCANCGIAFAYPEDFRAARKDDGRTIYCPNGHNLSYHETNADKLKKQLATERRWYADQLEAATADAKHQKRIAAAAKGRITKMKNRIAAGVCPAPGCKRSGLGGDVVKHLKSCHPDFVVIDE